MQISFIKEIKLSVLQPNGAQMTIYKNRRGRLNIKFFFDFLKLSGLAPQGLEFLFKLLFKIQPGFKIEMLYIFQLGDLFVGSFSPRTEEYTNSPRTEGFSSPQTEGFKF